MGKRHNVRNAKVNFDLPVNLNKMPAKDTNMGTKKVARENQQKGKKKKTVPGAPQKGHSVLDTARSSQKSKTVGAIAVVMLESKKKGVVGKVV